ncbi:MAG: pyrimidine 5'-nucleotidase [Rhodospirillales bacterium]|nr:pyrimidine 5'-nucleotidase [Rhodospirillales bacterium]
MTDEKLKNSTSWVFDLDNTLYPAGANLFDQIDKRMCSFIADYLDIDHAEAYRTQKRYFREHGTTLRGLMDHHDMDPAPYLDYVHDVDLGPIMPDLRMDQALGRLTGRKFVFTNATLEYAERVLERISIKHHFAGIFDIVAASYVPKPAPVIYEKMVSRFEIEPEGAVMVEDIVRNLGPAADMGMTTVWVETGRPWAEADAEILKPHHRTDDLSRWLAEVAGI